MLFQKDYFGKVYYFVNFHLGHSFFSFQIHFQNMLSYESNYLQNSQINLQLGYWSQMNNYKMADSQPSLNNHFQIALVISNEILKSNLTSRFQLDQVLKYEGLGHPFCLILKFNFLEAVFKASSYYFETLQLTYSLINFAKIIFKIGSKSYSHLIMSLTYFIPSKSHQVNFSCSH